MALVSGGDTISDWTVTLLTKFLEDFFKHHPLPSIQRLKVDTLEVKDATVTRKAMFTASDLAVVGGTGAAQFQNSATHYGAPYSKVGYIKDPAGFVRLVGVGKNGTIGSPWFTLPPGFRPAVAPGPFAVVSNGVFGRVDVGVDGTVTPISPSNNASVSFEGITFQAA